MKNQKNSPVPPVVARRPGGRTAQTTQKILTATEELLASTPPEDLTLGMVARTAGVNEATIYRKWGTKESLLAQVLINISEAKLPITDTGKIKEDFYSVLESIATYLQTPQGLALLKFGMKEDYPKIQALRESFWGDRFCKMEKLFKKAQERGDIASWEEGLKAYEMAVALIHFRLLERGEKIEPEELKQVVNLLVRSLLIEAS